MITVGYAAAHPRLKALDFQPSALLLSEAVAVRLKIFMEIRVKTTNDSCLFRKIQTSTAQKCGNTQKNSVK